MEKIFNRTLEELNMAGAYHTANEINHQPRLWRETINIIKSNSQNISRYVTERLKKKDIRIILTGAGTSAYIGDTAAPYLSKLLGSRVEAIATTDIVACPDKYFEKETPTIVVSFARSGNSPESVAAYNLAEKLVDNLSQIVITCNREGELAKRARANDENLVILLPEESNDKGFAMTSSFSCMLLAVTLVFDLNNLYENLKKFEEVMVNSERILKEESEEILKLVKLGYDRVVYLGSSVFKGLSREAALKNLELTSGRVFTTSETVLGFRHGPKSIINEKTLIFMFLSNDPYTRKYDMDLLRELKNDGGDKKVSVISCYDDGEVKTLSDKTFIVSNKGEGIEDMFAAFTYVLYAQVFALLYSMELGISPDNPRPDGTVNRVVKGVNIYEYNNQ